jgi:hypothetical protein
LATALPTLNPAIPVDDLSQGSFVHMGADIKDDLLKDNLLEVVVADDDLVAARLSNLIFRKESSKVSLPTLSTSTRWSAPRCR